MEEYHKQRAYVKGFWQQNPIDEEQAAPCPTCCLVERLGQSEKSLLGKILLQEQVSIAQTDRLRLAQSF